MTSNADHHDGHHDDAAGAGAGADADAAAAAAAAAAAGGSRWVDHVRMRVGKRRGQQWP